MPRRSRKVGGRRGKRSLESEPGLRCEYDFWRVRSAWNNTRPHSALLVSQPFRKRAFCGSPDASKAGAHTCASSTQAAIIAPVRPFFSSKFNNPPGQVDFAVKLLNLYERGSCLRNS
jgi:hypothetical protein